MPFVQVDCILLGDINSLSRDVCIDYDSRQVLIYGAILSIANCNVDKIISRWAKMQS